MHSSWVPFPRAEPAKQFLEGNHLHVSHSLSSVNPHQADRPYHWQNPRKDWERLWPVWHSNAARLLQTPRVFKDCVSELIMAQKLSLSSAFSLKESHSNSLPYKINSWGSLSNLIPMKEERGRDPGTERGASGCPAPLHPYQAKYTLSGNPPFFLAWLLPFTNESDFPRQCLLKLLWSLLANAFYFFISFVLLLQVIWFKKPLTLLCNPHRPICTAQAFSDSW